jgi:electron transport complex protein RnfD
MAEEIKAAGAPESADAHICVGPGPHIIDTKLTTRRMMFDVVVSLVPVMVAAGIVFRSYALRQVAICVGACLGAELLFTAARRKPVSIGDLSAVVTGLILAFSIPGTAPWYVGVIGGVVAIGIGKIVFGGLGHNIFNPAMVGRAFVMIAFAGLMGAPGYVDVSSAVHAITRATPMEAFKQDGAVAPLLGLFLGNTNGSLGETSALACLIGGLYLCVRRTASWEIPAGVVASVVVLGVLADLSATGGMLTMLLKGDLAGLGRFVGGHWTFLHELLGGAVLFGAFFIATDPVTSPLTPRGKFTFGLGIGALVMLLRQFSSYPEGVMFSVLLMNALVPMINRCTIPRPVGGPAPAPVKAKA